MSRALVVLALAATLTGYTVDAPSRPPTIIEAEQSPLPAGVAPDQTGQLLTIAIANLELEGFTVTYVSDSGREIWRKGNSVVISQKQNGNAVLLTVTQR